jgi:hypothetical protein
MFASRVDSYLRVMTEDERLQKVASLMARRLSAGPLLTVRADRWTRAAMTASCAVSVLGCGWLIATTDPTSVAPAVSQREPAAVSDGDARTPASTLASVGSLPPPPPLPVEDADDDADDDAMTYGTAAEVAPPGGSDVDAITGGS